MKDPKPQPTSAKMAEARRPFHGNDVSDDPVIKKRFRRRAEIMLNDLQMLARRGIALSPFLEIGAGSVQRSAALINNYEAAGAATDISQNSLKDSPFVISMLGYDRLPMLVCCDAHHVPFLPDSFQFVFAYQTFHHFANPVPVFAECHRVLGNGGHLFFNEEPMDSSLRRFLRGDRVLSQPPTRLQKLGYFLGVQKLFWDDGDCERKAGITEARFDLELWRTSLAPFTILDMEVNQKLHIHSDLKNPKLQTVLSGLIGGNIKGLCRKDGGEAASRDFRKRLMCLDCRSTQFSERTGEILICENCSREYPITDGIIRMLPRHLDTELYPA